MDPKELLVSNIRRKKWSLVNVTAKPCDGKMNEEEFMNLSPEEIYRINRLQINSLEKLHEDDAEIVFRAC